MLSIVVLLVNLIQTSVCCVNVKSVCSVSFTFCCLTLELIVSTISFCPNSNSMSCVVYISVVFVVVNSDLSIVIVNKTFWQCIKESVLFEVCGGACDVRKFRFQFESKYITFTSCCCIMPTVVLLFVTLC